MELQLTAIVALTCLVNLKLNIINKKEGRREIMKSRFHSGSASWPAIAFILSILLIIGGAFALHYTKGKSITVQDISSASKLSGLNFTHQEKR